MKQLKDMPWITKDGYFDMAKFPIDNILRQALQNGEEFREALRMLEAMQSKGRKEAGIFLIGLLVNCEDDWEKLTSIVESLEGFDTTGCAHILFAELKRVKSSNTTRRYLGAVLDILSLMPLELIESEFESLIDDTTFSYKMRNKFKELLERAHFRNKETF